MDIICGANLRFSKIRQNLMVTVFCLRINLMILFYSVQFYCTPVPSTPLSHHTKALISLQNNYLTANKGTSIKIKSPFHLIDGKGFHC